MSKKRIIIISVFVILFIISLFVGVSKEVTLKALLSGNKNAWLVFTRSRLPRTIVIVLTASSLSIAGLIMQSLSRNKFISPSTAGTTNAAVLGVLISFIFLKTSNMYVKFIFAFIFAMLSSILFMTILKKLKFRNVVYIPLIGLMYGGLIAAISSILAYETNLVQVLASLNLGTFSHIGILNSSLLIILIPSLVFAVMYSNRFSIASLGEDFSKNLGVNYQRTMFAGLIVVSIISASTFIVVGPIPFLGLIIPNIISMYYGDNVKKNLFDVAIFGSAFVLLNDIFSRIIIYPYEVSVGFTMGITGAIIFMILIFKKVKNHG